MTEQERERMNQLVQQIQLETDQAAFTALVEELNELLDPKSRRFPPSDPSKTK